MPESKLVRLRVRNEDTKQICGFLSRKPASGNWPTVKEVGKAGSWSRTGGGIKAVQKQYLAYLQNRYVKPPKITFEIMPITE